METDVAVQSEGSPASLRLAFAGQALLRRPLDRHDPGLRELFVGVDLAIANLEGVIATPGTGWPMREGPVHVAGPEALDSLAALGLAGLSLAGNHAFDLGPPGISSTLTEVQRRGILKAGTGNDATAAAQPGVVEIGGHAIALVAVTSAAEPANAHALDANRGLPARPGVNPLHVDESLSIPAGDLRRLEQTLRATGLAERTSLRDRIVRDRPIAGSVEVLGTSLSPGDPAWVQDVDAADEERALAAISRASAEKATVIAHVHQHHWAADWHLAPAWLRAFARRCFQAGATIFVGHGPPVLMEHEWIDGRLALYGLGNLVFQTMKPERYPDEVWDGRVALVTVDTVRRRVTELAWRTIRLESDGPKLLDEVSEIEHPIE